MFAFGDATSIFAIAMLALAFTLGVLVANISMPQRRRFRDWYRPNKYPSQAPNATDPGQQLNAVMAGSFERRRVLSSSEYRVFAVVEKEIAARRAGLRVFAQTSLGQVLRSTDLEAFRSINSKRVDILVIDRGGWPILAIEYQGNGHYQGTAAARDAVKKEALRKAGVRYIECGPGDTVDQIRYRVREQLAWPPAEPGRARV